MTRSKVFAYSCAVLCAAALAAAPAARAELNPDPEGAVRALLSIPLDAAGDAIGAGGLIGALVIAVDGDVVALVDDNEFTHPFLRGFASTPIRRAALGLSRLGTVALEGIRASDFSRLPVSEPPYLRPDDGGSHLRTFRLGFGAIGLIIVDSLANTGLFVTRAIGANEVEEQLARAKTYVRTAWVGPATEGDTESGAVSLAVQQPN